MRPRFHLAIPVHDLDLARSFYVGVLGCAEGRSSADWVDFDLHEHQLVTHRVLDAPVERPPTNPVDGDAVPIPHFGLLLPWEAWHALADRLRAANTQFVIEPHVRFRGEIGEQATLFLLDPSGNALEFKSFRDESRVFAQDA